MLTAQDDELLGVSNRSDAMGVLAIWSVRGRDLVPHLTEQTTQVRGFQILVEAFRLWELYEPSHPEHAGRLDDFFLLVEQAFARTVGWIDEAWELPGARRVRARSWEEPHISLRDPSWHLLGGQKANGLWGLYRGASRRAGLLSSDGVRLSPETMKEGMLRPGVQGLAQTRLFGKIAEAMEGATVELPTRMTNKLTRGLYDTYWELPLAEHLYARLIEGQRLTQELADRLLELDELDHRALLATAARELPEYRASLEDGIRCEDLISVVEAVFEWLCASKGDTLELAVRELPVDLEALSSARTAFGHTGHYPRGASLARQRRFYEQLDCSSKIELARSILGLHRWVSESRKRAPWVWEEGGVLCCDIELDRPSELALAVGVAWRNDYYLKPLQNVARQLEEVRS